MAEFIKKGLEGEADQFLEVPEGSSAPEGFVESSTLASAPAPGPTIRREDTGIVTPLVTPKDVLQQAGGVTSADLATPEVTTARQDRTAELRGLLGQDFETEIRRRRELGEKQIGGTKAALGLSRGLGVSSSRSGFILAQQTQINRDITDLIKAKEASLLKFDIVEGDRIDEQIRLAREHQTELIKIQRKEDLDILKVRAGLPTTAEFEFGGQTFKGLKETAAAEGKPVTLSPGASLFTPTGELLATAPLKPTTNKPVTQLIDNDTGGKDLWQWNPLAIDETTGGQGVWELKVEAPEGASILDFSEISPLDQLKARNLSVEIFGKRAGTKQENIDLISGLVQTGLTIDDIQDKLRFSSQSEAFTGVYRDAAESIATTFSDGKATRFFDALDRHLEAGEFGKARDLIEKNAISGVGTAEAQGIRGKKRTVEFLQEIERDLKLFELNGGKTGFFKGKIEKLAGRVGQVPDPELRKIATKISTAIQSYRRALSGVAFSVPESKEYEAMFPNIDKVGEFNTANIEALIETFDGDLQFFFGSQMGDDAFQQIFNDKDVTDAITDTPSADTTELRAQFEASGIDDDFDDLISQFGAEVVQQVLDANKPETPPEPFNQDLSRSGKGLLSLGVVTGLGSPFWKHGLDIDLKIGDPVPSPVSGKVVFAGVNGGFGNQVRILTSQGNEVWLSHLDGFDVKEGDTITSGQFVARGGNSGNVIPGPGGDGSHVDVTVIKPDGTFFTPQDILNQLQTV